MQLAFGDTTFCAKDILTATAGLDQPIGGVDSFARLARTEANCKICQSVSVQPCAGSTRGVTPAGVSGRGRAAGTQPIRK